MWTRHPSPRRRHLSISALLAAALVASVTAMPAPASASSVTITGEPTDAERGAITSLWNQFFGFFGPYQGCMGPVEVQVVARAEDHYPGDVGAIGAFYRRGGTVVVEHGKVNGTFLYHEFGHHLDLSCGFGSGNVGAAFKVAQGIPADQGWRSGSSWADVPAEAFAEAVTAVLGGGTSIAITAAASSYVRGLSAGREAAPAAPQPEPEPAPEPPDEPSEAPAASPQPPADRAAEPAQQRAADPEPPATPAAGGAAASASADRAPSSSAGRAAEAPDKAKRPAAPPAAIDHAAEAAAAMRGMPAGCALGRLWVSPARAWTMPCGAVVFAV